MTYRTSKYIDFNTGDVFLAPMDLKNSLSLPWSDDQKVDLFECRVDVWILGVAVAMLKQIEEAQKSSVWQHAAYGLLTVSFTYFEMIGKTLNNESGASHTAGNDFNFGFCDVYQKFKPNNGIYTDKLPVPKPPKTKKISNRDIQDVIEYRDRIRNGLYHLGYTKSGLWIHNDAGCTEDFETQTETDPANAKPTIVKYRVNPHRLTRTIVDHFPKFVTRVRSDANLMANFIRFFDQFLSG